MTEPASAACIAHWGQQYLDHYAGDDGKCRRCGSPPVLTDDDLPELTYDAPPGTALVGYYCWRGGGHVDVQACKSDSVPLFAQAGWAERVRHALIWGSDD